MIENALGAMTPMRPFNFGLRMSRKLLIFVVHCDVFHPMQFTLMPTIAPLSGLAKILRLYVFEYSAGPTASVAQLFCFCCAPRRYDFVAVLKTSACTLFVPCYSVNCCLKNDSFWQ